MNSKESCQCKICVGCCKHSPGWFKPGEAEKTAVHLGVSLQELFGTQLVVDWYWDANGNNIFLLSPAIISNLPGTFLPADPRGICVFLKDNLCSIHSVKPFECRETLHSDTRAETDKLQESTALCWQEHQGQIKVLLDASQRQLLGKQAELDAGFAEVAEVIEDALYGGRSGT